MPSLVGIFLDFPVASSLRNGLVLRTIRLSVSSNARCSLIRRFENPTMSMKRTWASSNSVSFVASLDIVFIHKGASLDQCEGAIGLKLRRYWPVVAFCAGTAINGTVPQYDFGLIDSSGTARRQGTCDTNPCSLRRRKLQPATWTWAGRRTLCCFGNLLLIETALFPLFPPVNLRNETTRPILA